MSRNIVCNEGPWTRRANDKRKTLINNVYFVNAQWGNSFSAIFPSLVSTWSRGLPPKAPGEQLEGKWPCSRAHSGANKGGGIITLQSSPGQNNSRASGGPKSGNLLSKSLWTKLLRQKPLVSIVHMLFIIACDNYACIEETYLLFNVTNKED